MKELSFHTKLMSLIFVHFILMCYAMITHWSIWIFLIALVIIKIITNLGNEIGLHRLWSHKSFKTTKFKEYLLHVCATPLLCGSSIAYVGVHRQHHLYSDTEKDPHITTSWWKVLFYIRDSIYDIKPKIVADLIKDPVHKWLHTYYFKINLILLVVCLLILGPVYTGWSLSFMVIYNMLIIWCINWFGHKPYLGNRLYETNDNSYNSLIIKIVTLGNHGLHQNHHFKPSSHTVALNSNEFDSD